MDDRANAGWKDKTFVGADGFGDRARSFLRRADELFEHYAEVLTAIREYIRSCEEIIADCKASVDRIERRLPGATARH